MKIKSWTGNEVEARAKMTVRFTPKSRIAIENGAQEVTFKVVAVVDNNDGIIWLSDGDNWYNIENCTMLKCPFAVGDLVQGFDDSIGAWLNETLEITDVFFTLAAMHPRIKFRHANPDLRTSPEYKP